MTQNVLTKTKTSVSKQHKAQLKLFFHSSTDVLVCIHSLTDSFIFFSQIYIWSLNLYRNINLLLKIWWLKSLKICLIHQKFLLCPQLTAYPLRASADDEALPIAIMDSMGFEEGEDGQCTGPNLTDIEHILDGQFEKMEVKLTFFLMWNGFKLSL